MQDRRQRNGRKNSKRIKPDKTKSKEVSVEQLPERQLPLNSTIQTAADSYIVVAKIGAGGFGDVYEVMRQTDKATFAVKVEFSQLVEEKRLEKEYEVYRALAHSTINNQKLSRHLMPVTDYGECGAMAHFLFLPLCGASLESLYKKKTFSMNSKLRITWQTLEALQALHLYGFIHRDIKPANYTFGRGSESHIVYLIDFGMATRFCIDSSKMPKSSVYEFIGTLRYASRTTHMGNPQSRKDDLESWLYVVLEVFDRKILPWKDEKDNKPVHESKQAFFDDGSECTLLTTELAGDVFAQVPSCFPPITKAIAKYGPFDTPDYDYLFECISHTARRQHCNVDQGFSFNGSLNRK